MDIPLANSKKMLVCGDDVYHRGLNKAGVFLGDESPSVIKVKTSFDVEYWKKSEVEECSID